MANDGLGYPVAVTTYGSVYKGKLVKLDLDGVTIMMRPNDEMYSTSGTRIHIVNIKSVEFK